MIFDNFFHDLRIDLPFPICIVSLICSEIFSFEDFRSFGDIYFNLFVPSQISLFHYFLFAKARIDQICGRIVEIERIHCRREELSERSLLFHFTEDFIYLFIPFLFGVLFIEDTKALIF